MKHIDAETAFDPLVTGWMKNFVRQHAVMVPFGISLGHFAFSPLRSPTHESPARDFSRCRPAIWSGVDQSGSEAARPARRECPHTLFGHRQMKNNGSNQKKFRPARGRRSKYTSHYRIRRQKKSNNGIVGLARLFGTAPLLNRPARPLLRRCSLESAIQRAAMPPLRRKQDRQYACRFRNQAVEKSRKDGVECGWSGNAALRLARPEQSASPHVLSKIRMEHQNSRFDAPA